MPDIYTHYAFGAAVAAALPEKIRRRLIRPIYDVCTDGPDIWFSRGFYTRGRRKALSLRGSVCHNTETGRFLRALAAETMAQKSPDCLFSYLCGYLCHYALDSVCHPYIIWSTGYYDGTEKTLYCRGNHTYLERTLDCRQMQKAGVTLHDRFITRQIVRLRRFPKEMKNSIDLVYQAVYGWDNVYRELNHGLRDMRLFYGLVQTPGKWMDSFVRWADDGVGNVDLTSLTYYGKQQPSLDAENLGHSRWHHPGEPEVSSCDSFPELQEKAKTLALELIGSAYDCVYEGGTLGEETFGNRSYVTGFDWDDVRNDRPCKSSPMVFPAKQKNCKKKTFQNQRHSV